jgi:hypothetical protein
LLLALAPSGRVVCDDEALSSPFEIAVAQARGLPFEPGRIPWAAFETGTFGQPCAWIHPCHWEVGADHVLLAPTESLALDDATSRELLAAVAPYFLEDGITLCPQAGAPGRWLGLGEPFRNLTTMSLERAVGRRLTPAFLGPSGQSAALLRRLQNEMQMLLYTHPATEARQHQGLLPVNSFWVTGAGELAGRPEPRGEVQVESRLQACLLTGDAGAHQQTWNAVDAERCAPLLAALRAGDEVRLTLCGEHVAQTWGPQRTGAWRRAVGALRIAQPSLETFGL